MSEENLASAAFGYVVVIDGDRLAAGVISALVGGKQGAGEVYLYSLKPTEQDNVAIDFVSTFKELLVLSGVIVFLLVVVIWRVRDKRNGTI
ncbi:MAG: hypothetical protein NTY03_08860 [Candidatus Bathyarchaeota archaeon]|nr:hypothetical protein [Candidatus Bathyarchaeota archaeon]